MFSLEQEAATVLSAVKAVNIILRQNFANLYFIKRFNDVIAVGKLTFIDKIQMQL